MAASSTHLEIACADTPHHPPGADRTYRLAITPLGLIATKPVQPHQADDYSLSSPPTTVRVGPAHEEIALRQ
jgi:hypothetical protein